MVRNSLATMVAYAPSTVGGCRSAGARRISCNATAFASTCWLLMRTGKQLHRVGQLTVPGDRAVMLAVQAHDLGQHMRVTGVALRARGGMPLAVACGRQRVDRIHLVGPALG